MSPEPAREGFSPTHYNCNTITVLCQVISEFGRLLEPHPTSELVSQRIAQSEMVERGDVGSQALLRGSRGGV